MSATTVNSSEPPIKATASKPKKRFVGRSTLPSSAASISLLARQIPQDILDDPILNKVISECLPSNYSFEIHKTIWNVRKNESKMVGLQMPEGLQMFACAIADIIERFTSALTVILGDVTYGACCIDDYTALALGCDLLVHYGHSCLVPIDTTTIKTLYVFVEIGIDSVHLHQTVRRNLPSDREEFHSRHLQSSEEMKRIKAGDVIEAASLSALRIEAPTDGGAVARVDKVKPKTRLALVSTIQFAAALQKLKEDLNRNEQGENSTELVFSESSSGPYEATIPRSKPLSPGEILGCTAPRVKDVDALIYLGDGRFHLEAMMIANPELPAFRYDPYSKKLTREWYEHEEMRGLRRDAIVKAKDTMEFGTTWGVVLGTLGRQGSLKQMEAILRQIEHVPSVPILLSELSPAKLSLFSSHISTFIQTSCPRLSIDWGYAFEKPLLNPYEAAVAVGRLKAWWENEEGYPMDFYEAGSMWAISRVKGWIMTTKGDKLTLRLNVPARVLVIPSLCITTGMALGMIRGSRTASLRFLAENAHRAPTTVRGWYFYNKTKNYQMMFEGLKEGSKEALKIGSVGVAWVGIEQVVERFVPQVEPVKEVVAGASIGGIMTILVGRMTGRPMMLGSLVGGFLSSIRFAQRKIESRLPKSS